MRPAGLTITALISLLATVVLALLVAHGHSPYRFEDDALDWLGPPSAVSAWADVVDLLGIPVLSAVVAVSVCIGLLRKAFSRVVVYAALAAAALLTSEHLVKPLVQRTYDAELTFPSGSVTAVAATALAMWLALGPVLGTRERRLGLLLGISWTLLMSVAVVGALWHTPLDCLGSVLLSIGIVTAGGALFEWATGRRPSVTAVRVGTRTGRRRSTGSA
ncbi:MAG: phosphatase PAP2 family protein [Acidimicrobiales bacterium]|nr:phosphatase PAP2 family protein [Acidimicrobiales bacterium]